MASNEMSRTRKDREKKEYFDKLSSRVAGMSRDAVQAKLDDVSGRIGKLNISPGSDRMSTRDALWSAKRKDILGSASSGPTSDTIRKAAEHGIAFTSEGKPVWSSLGSGRGYNGMLVRDIAEMRKQDQINHAMYRSALSAYNESKREEIEKKGSYFFSPAGRLELAKADEERRKTDKLAREQAKYTSIMRDIDKLEENGFAYKDGKWSNGQGDSPSPAAPVSEVRSTPPPSIQPSLGTQFSSPGQPAPTDDISAVANGEAPYRGNRPM